MKKLLALAAVAEIATGAALAVMPSLVVRLLLGVNLSGLEGRDDLAAVGIVIGRVTGIALIALGLACWPREESTKGAFCGMMTYSALATLYLACLGFGGEWGGPFLWPAVVLHAVITTLLGRAWLVTSKAGGRNNPTGEQGK